MRLLFLFLILLTFLGCSSGRSLTEHAGADYDGGAPKEKRMLARQANLEAMSFSADMAAAPSMAMVSAVGGSAGDAYGNVATQSAGSSADKRMVYYNGGVTFKATQPAAALDTAAAWAAAVDGFVESRSGNYSVLRIPVERFRDFFAKVQQLGAVQHKWMRADDITEAFQDNALRIRIAEATLSRLQELLAASTSDEEKMQLLREIQRVSDELEQRRNQQTILARQAAYSRLELEAQPFSFEAVRADQGIHAFAWFQELNPQRASEKRLGKKIALQVPATMVALDLRKSWAASSSDGVELWAFQRRNNPRGDAAFWQQALRNGLATAFARADTFSAGNFSVLRLESHGPESYVWWIAIQTDGKKLYVAEAFFPDLAAETRHGEAVRHSLAGGIQ